MAREKGGRARLNRTDVQSAGISLRLVSRRLSFDESYRSAAASDGENDQRPSAAGRHSVVSHRVLHVVWGAGVWRAADKITPFTDSPVIDRGNVEHIKRVITSASSSLSFFFFFNRTIRVVGAPCVRSGRVVICVSRVIQ